MATAETSSEVSTLVTVGPFYSSTEGGGFSSEASADCGYGAGESTTIMGAISSVGATIEATSAGPEIFGVIFFKDTMPYHKVDNRATRFYARIKRKKLSSCFPVLIAENEHVLSQFQTTFGTERSKILETLDVLEQLIYAAEHES